VETHLRTGATRHPDLPRPHDRGNGDALYIVSFQYASSTLQTNSRTNQTDKLDELNWIVTAYTLTSTAFIPAFGQLADVFGRYAVLQLAVFLTLVGSTLCAAAQSWGMLLLGRALQGTGSAGTMNVVMIILADKVSLRENAKNNSIFAFIAGVGYAVGPEIGG
jgi:MFS family permease